VYSQDTTRHAVLTGSHKVEHIESSGSHTWFHKNYNEYIYDTLSVEALKKLGSDYRIIVVAATWCADTHLQLPRFYKVIDDAQISRDKIKLYFVDKELKDHEMVSKTYKIKKVPTFILFKGEKEITRIVETPKLSIEKDLVKNKNTLLT
jgi:thiol-disulfide isomerase/thioredoxin